MGNGPEEREGGLKVFVAEGTHFQELEAHGCFGELDGWKAWGNRACG